MGRGWVSAGELGAGDLLQEPDGSVSIVVSVDSERRQGQGVAVYNFKVADSHTYFVRAEGSLAEPVWVHNAYDAKRDALVDIEDFYVNEEGTVARDPAIPERY